MPFATTASMLVSMFGIGIGVACFVAYTIYTGRQQNMLLESRPQKPFIPTNTEYRNNDSNVVKRRLKESNEDMCAVCQFTFKLYDTKRALRCHHVFHYDCINEWEKESKQCPVCRKEF